ncbi:hypothetical protein CYMTET_38364 [Cymbomonas tetramitiformis]|uniref:OTU domain-containing protein n=1 Tax=Cymbomonas tetramitiformis TaxID=36881 RepID=A0AAE0CE96_9CHLO|nr:hypothetical protein CYMTET_38364 [Cymbomonas tetramitiformis]
MHLPIPKLDAPLAEILVYVDRLIEVHAATATPDFFAFFELSRVHTLDERVRKRRYLSRLLHPDRHARKYTGPDIVERLTSGMQLVNAIFDRLPKPSVAKGVGRGTKRRAEHAAFWEDSLFDSHDEDDECDDPLYFMPSDFDTLSSTDDDDNEEDDAELHGSLYAKRGQRRSQRVRQPETELPDPEKQFDDSDDDTESEKQFDNNDDDSESEDTDKAYGNTWQEAKRRMHNKVEAAGREIVKTPVDHSCMYHAIAYGMYHADATEYAFDENIVEAMRTATANRLQLYKHDYLSFFEGEPADYDKAVEDIKKYTTWGDEMALRALADTYKELNNQNVSIEFMTGPWKTYVRKKEPFPGLYAENGVITPSDGMVTRLEALNACYEKLQKNRSTNSVSAIPQNDATSTMITDSQHDVSVATEVTNTESPAANMQNGEAMDADDPHTNTDSESNMVMTDGPSALSKDFDKSAYYELCCGTISFLTSVCDMKEFEALLKPFAPVRNINEINSDSE